MFFTVAVLLSALLLAPAYAAPAPKVSPGQSQGLSNAKKVMKARFDREKKMDQIRKKAQAKKHQAEGKQP